MPYRRYSRRGYSRRGYRPRRRYGKRAVKRTLQKFSKLGFHAFKCRTIPNVITDGSNRFYYGFSLTNPNSTTSINGAAYANSVTDWASLSGMFDQYRVAAIKVKYIPHLPNDNSVTTGFGSCYSYIDYDSATVNTNANTISEFENMKVHNLWRPFKRYLKVPKRMIAGTGPQVGAGWFDLAAPQATGHVGFFAETLDNSTQYGNFVVTYYILAKNRR